MDIPILATKLFIPEPRKEFVARKRLLDMLDEGMDKKMILVSAPAGFGKSTLVSSWAIRSNKKVAWFSLDKDDNQMTRFLNHLAAALRKVEHTSGERALHMLSATSQVPAETVLTSLINDLDKARHDICLVLEDYHHIDNKDIHEAAAFLLEHIPQNLHLLITTRSDPPLPIARLRARGEIHELRAADLRFNRSEAIQFLNDSMGLNLQKETAAALEERTEGWAAGLQMAALSMRSLENTDEFIRDFSGTNRYIMDYLLEEVLSNQTSDIQQFLLRTSILRQLTAPLCDALLETGVKKKTPTSTSAPMLEYLEKGNLFLIPMDAKRKWYRYHDLFADMLQTRLQQTRPDLLPQLHIQASTWLQQKGFISEAIHHLYSANDFEQAADLIERYGPLYLAQNDPSILQMADDLPQDLVLARPKTALYRAWLLIVQGQMAEAIPLLADLKDRFALNEQALIQRWMRTFVSLASTFLFPGTISGELAPLPDYALLDEIPAEETILRNAADYLYAMTLARQEDMEGAIDVSIKCIQREKQNQQPKVIPTLAPFLSRIYLMQGHLTKTASLCEEYLKPIKKGDFQIIYTSSSMLIDLGEVFLERNQLDAAEQNIREGLRVNQLWRNIMTEGFGLAALTRLYLAELEYDKAIETVDRFEAVMTAPGRPNEFEEDLLTIRARVQLASGDLENATRWADQVQHRVEYERDQDLYRLTLAHIRLAQNKYKVVEKLLAGASLPSAVGSQISRRLESDLLLAAAAAGQQREKEAVGLLENCLRTAEPEGYTRVFLDMGVPIRELLNAYVQSPNHAHKAFAQQVLDAFSCSQLERSENRQPGGLIEPLSEREIEVLILLASGKTNREIANQLFIAPGTVKAHTSSIYRKLNVFNRTEAAAKARQLGILS